jgi:hypothetical protein
MVKSKHQSWSCIYKWHIRVSHIQHSGIDKAEMKYTKGRVVSPHMNLHKGSDIELFNKVSQNFFGSISSSASPWYYAKSFWTMRGRRPGCRLATIACRMSELRWLPVTMLALLECEVIAGYKELVSCRDPLRLVVSTSLCRVFSPVYISHYHCHRLNYTCYLSRDQLHQSLSSGIEGEPCTL